MAPRRQELIFDALLQILQLETDVGRLLIKVVNAETEEQQFLLEKKFQSQ